jgi:hypothetical protein
MKFATDMCREAILKRVEVFKRTDFNGVSRQLRDLWHELGINTWVDLQSNKTKYKCMIRSCKTPGTTPVKCNICHISVCGKHCQTACTNCLVEERERNEQ